MQHQRGKRQSDVSSQEVLSQTVSLSEEVLQLASSQAFLCVCGCKAKKCGGFGRGLSLTRTDDLPKGHGAYFSDAEKRS